jgi:hypothetical protein
MRARVVSCLFLLIALASPAFAADRQSEGRPSFDRILPEIRRHTPGTFYDAEGPFIGQDGQARYRIKWMTPEGRIVWFDADARTGRVLGAVPYPRSRYDDDRYGGDRSQFDRYDGDRYGNGRYGNDRDDRNSGRFRNWPGYDRGQGDRGNRDWGRGDRDRDGGGWSRGGSERGNSGRGDSGGDRRGRH